MKELTKKELKEIHGGAISVAAGLIITGIVVFVIGVIDGYLRPIACHK